MRPKTASCDDPLAASLFLRRLEREICGHPAVQHPFLKRFSKENLSLRQIQTFGLQHYQLVRVFTTYITHLTPRLPAVAAVSLRRILGDEYGKNNLFESHVHLYQRFLRALGLLEEDWGSARKLPGTERYIREHLALAREENTLFALGAVGPAHETAIPVMFEFILRGLRKNTALDDAQMRYFTLHISEDKEHADIFNRLISPLAQSESEKGRVRAGALKSLRLRAAFWQGLSRRIFA